MSHHVPEVFSTTIGKTMIWLKQVQTEAGLKDEKQAYVALRAVLHTLRDRLPVQEAIQLGAQLPMLIRGFYYEGFKPDLQNFPNFSSEAFMNLVEQRAHLDPEPDPAALTRSVFKVLSEHISAGETIDLVHVLPQSLKDLWPSPLVEAERIKDMVGHRTENTVAEPPPGASTASMI